MTERKRRRRKSSLAEQVEKRDRSKEIEPEEHVGPSASKITEDRLIPSGSTLINCACSDNPKGAFALGSINTMPGKSSSGKTIIMLTMLTCCAVQERFDDYDLILDDAEAALGFDLEDLFPPLVDRLKAPRYNKEGEELHSNTIQELKQNVLRKCKEGKPFIYVLDSLDTLTTTEEEEREYKAALNSAVKQGEKSVEAVKGAYKMEKAKHLGETLRMINGQLKHSDSALFIIQQTRQNIAGGFGAPKWVTSGGEAPYFYSYHRIYTNQVKSLTAEGMNIKHNIGGLTQVEVIKNKLTGKKRKNGIIIPIYESYGCDDIGSCVDFLKLTKYWKSSSAGIDAKEFDLKMSRDKLVEEIENEGLEEDLSNLVGEVWLKMEDELKLNRKRKF